MSNSPSSGKAISVTKVAIAALAVAFILLNVWAFQATPMHGSADFLRGPMAELSQAVPSQRWVTVVVADLFLGWFLATLLVWRLERRHWVAVLWIVGVFAIGNLVTAIYLLLRIDRIDRGIDTLRASISTRCRSAHRCLAVPAGPASAEAVDERTNRCDDRLVGRLIANPTSPEVVQCSSEAFDGCSLRGSDALGAPSAVVYSRTGTCTQKFGTLTNFLQDVINLLTGNLDSAGGWLFPAGPIDFAGFAAAAGMATYHQFHTRVSGLPEVLGMLPSRGLAEDIVHEGPGRIRALCSMGANPVLSSSGGGADLEAALEDLELHFAFDLYQNETNKHAHYLLPVCSMYEREDIPLTFLGNMLRPTVFATEPVIAPLGQCRQEWDVLNDIARRMGLGGAYAIKPLRILARLGVRVTPRTLADILLRTGPYGDLFGLRPKGISFKKILERHPDGLRLSDELPTGAIRKKLRTQDQKSNLMPAPIRDELTRLHPEERSQYPFRLTGMRQTRSHNTWMHNVERLTADGKSPQRLLIHPADAQTIGLCDGDLARIASPAAEIVVPVEVTDAMFPGNVALPHGWGHDGGWRHANRLAGTNSNVLAGRYEGDVERLAGMSVLNGIPVQLAPAAERQSAAPTSHTMQASR